MSEPWQSAVRAARLFAVDPAALGGVVLRARAGPARDRWLALLRDLLPDVPIRRVPLHIADDRLLGGLDLAATLAAGRPVAARGLLAEAHGGILVLAMAERVTPATAARLTAVLDTGSVSAERDGFALSAPARLGVVALDEGDDEAAPPALQDRLAFHVDLGVVRAALNDAPEAADPEEIAHARTGLAGVTMPDTLLDGLCAAAAALGIASLRAPLLAARVARASASLAGRTAVGEDDVAEAARLVLAPRAMQLPATDPAPPPPTPQEAEDPGSPNPAQEEDGQGDEARDPTPEELILAAAQAAIPPDLLARLDAAGRLGARSGAAGRSGSVIKSDMRGRSAGVRAGHPGGGVRLDLLATLRAAAPWQRLRARADGRLAIRRDDFRIARRVQRARTTTIFAVDASGSSALNRLAEAKGAVELLLAECYVRRDRVALLSFRGQRAEILLPPTASLTRAKRRLAGLPGGGGTPLAHALDMAAMLVTEIRRQEAIPALVLLTDGKANVARDGTGDRTRATDEALAAARTLRTMALSSLVIDTSPRPQPQSRALAEAMGGLYVALPYADAAAMARAVRTMTA